MAAPRVGRLHCIDASAAALAVARGALASVPNVVFHEASLDRLPLTDGTMDFGYCLGVLHHLPDPARGLKACVAKLKSGAPMLVYVYYALDNRPLWFRLVWRTSDWIRRGLSRAPFRVKSLLAELFAAIVYWPLARGARLAERRGRDVGHWPLAAYRRRSYYSMRTDALDRFGTRVEHRLTRAQLDAMMQRAGLRDIRFSNAVPYWCALGFKA
ncbi:MAG: methyltransferase domain-containing protein [Alphaproteobacteria bacterium]|nr:methyltransferase domain-containing protein [Alphaproteobacteria bacterium]